MNSIRWRSPQKGIPILWIKSSSSNTVPSSPTHCKNETKFYTIVLLYVIVVVQEEGVIIIVDRVTGTLV